MFYKTEENELTGKYETTMSETADGIVDLDNNKEATIDVSGYTEPVEIIPTEGKDGMKKATVTLSNIPSGADLENNKNATIDVSAYTDPVEIIPTEGKDGMKKVTVTLSNMPAGSNMLYAWVNNNGFVVYFDFDISPASSSEFADKHQLVIEDNPSTGYPSGVISIQSTSIDASYYTRVSDIKWGIVDRDTSNYYTRDTTKDVEVWNAPPEVETTKQATIDVSTYDPSNKPVITPTAGKQSMGSVEVTLSNIPSSGSATAYAWVLESTIVYTQSETPNIGDPVLRYVNRLILDNEKIVESYDSSTNTIEWDGDTFTRSSTKDVTIW